MKLFVLLLSFNEISARARKRRAGPPYDSWFDFEDEYFWGDFDNVWAEDMRVDNPSRKLPKNIPTDASRGR